MDINLTVKNSAQFLYAFSGQLSPIHLTHIIKVEHAIVYQCCHFEQQPFEWFIVKP